MTKKQAEQIYEKYNPNDAVIRCPNGKASLRKLLDAYAKAAVNLYGIIRIKDLVEIFNNQNTEQTDADEVFTLLLPGVIKGYKSPAGGYYCFYKDCIINYLITENFDFGDNLLQAQNDKTRFIPEKNNLLKYADEYYEEEVQRLNWSKVLEYLLEKFDKDKWRRCIEFYDDLKECSQLIGNIDYNRLLQKHDLSFNDEKQIQKFLDLHSNAHNNTRMWINKGHTPAEIIEARKLEYQKNGQDKVVIREHKKVAPNGPCPCGSGKKYKKCCRLIQEARTAQLHWSECLLFYETWYGLMGFINDKKKIIPVQIKPIYPNPIGDDLIIKIREELWKNPEIITEYLASVNLPTGKAELLKSWRDRHIKGMFLLMEYKPEYAIAVSSSKNGEDKLYGITGISRSLAEVLQRELPVQFETVLLPFKNKIIYDCFISSMNVSFGKNIKEAFSEMYKKAGEKGIVTCL